MEDEVIDRETRRTKCKKMISRQETELSSKVFLVHKDSPPGTSTVSARVLCVRGKAYSAVGICLINRRITGIQESTLLLLILIIFNIIEIRYIYGSMPLVLDLRKRHLPSSYTNNPKSEESQ